MERIITLVSTRSQGKKYVWKSTATTLGELKAELRNQGVDYEGMAFYESISKSSFEKDDAQLPSNVIYKGQSTNNLVIMLTEHSKKITSGNSFTRKECYNYIKENNLQDKVKEVFGKNFTTVTTDNLNSFLSSLGSSEVCLPANSHSVDNVRIVASLQYLAKQLDELNPEGTAVDDIQAILEGEMVIGEDTTPVEPQKVELKDAAVKEEEGTLESPFSDEDLELLTGESVEEEEDDEDEDY